MTRKIAIFGATGNLGGCVLNAMLANDKSDDREVIAITHKRAALPEKIKTHTANYADLDSLIQALQDVDAMVYALPIDRKMQAWNANVVKAADICQVEKLVRFSGPLADAESSFLPLRIQGIMDECALERQSGKISIVRPNFFMQNFIAYHRKMVRNGRLAFAHGDGRISYIDLQDVGAAVLKMLQNFDDYDRQIIEMTGAVAWNSEEIAEMFSDVLKMDCAYQALDPESFRDSLVSIGMDAFQTQFIAELQELAQMNEFSYIGDGIHTILNRRPRSFHTFAFENRACWQ